jgi:hypothetical protein
MAVTACMIMPLAMQGGAASQDTPRLVETGVIFSAQQIERSAEINRLFDGVRPLWTPAPEDIARLESKLKPFLEDVSNGKLTEVADYWWRVPSQAKEILARVESYKRQYVGLTHGGKRWIYVNSFCEELWKRDDSWRDRFVMVLDGGSCFFTVLYDPSTQQFERLMINGHA